MAQPDLTPGTNPAIETITRAAVLRERYVKGTYSRLIGQLLKSELRIIQKIERRLEGMTGPDRARFMRDDWQTQRLVLLRESIQELANFYRTLANDAIRQSARELIAAEVDLALTVAETTGIQATLTRVSEYQIYTAAMSQPFNGRHLKEYMKGVEQGVRKRVLQSLRTSFANGESVPEAVAAIRGTRASNYSDGVMEISRRGATTIVRTAMTHMAARTHEQVYKDLGVQYVEYLSVLDNRTSSICMGLSRKIFKVGTNHPKPPQHLNCRSALLPVVDGYEDTDSQTARGPSGKIELVDSEFNYGRWLRTNPRWFIDERLGKTKAKLFMDGKLTLDKFVDLRRRRAYTIAELRQKYGEIFEMVAV